MKKFKSERLALPPSVLNLFNRMPQEDIPSLRKLVTGGAPVPNWLIRQTLKNFPNTECFVLYGSTEAEPISTCRFEEALVFGDDGYLVGRPISAIDVKVQPNREIILEGSHVVQRYLFNEADNRETKIPDARGKIWHRTKDTGYFDDGGRLWLTGRLSDRVHFQEGPFDVYPFEHRIENHFESRAALVQTEEGVHAGEVKLLLESSLLKLKQQDQEFINEVLKPLPQKIKIELRKTLPVDRRHFWKINRKELK